MNKTHTESSENVIVLQKFIQKAPLTQTTIELSKKPDSKQAFMLNLNEFLKKIQSLHPEFSQDIRQLNNDINYMIEPSKVDELNRYKEDIDKAMQNKQALMDAIAQLEGKYDAAERDFKRYSYDLGRIEGQYKDKEQELLNKHRQLEGDINRYAKDTEGLKESLQLERNRLEQELASVKNAYVNYNQLVQDKKNELANLNEAIQKQSVEEFKQLDAVRQALENKQYALENNYAQIIDNLELDYQKKQDELNQLNDLYLQQQERYEGYLQQVEQEYQQLKDEKLRQLNELDDSYHQQNRQYERLLNEQQQVIADNNKAIRELELNLQQQMASKENELATQLNQQMLAKQKAYDELVNQYDALAKQYDYYYTNSKETQGQLDAMQKQIQELAYEANRLNSDINYKNNLLEELTHEYARVRAHEESKIASLKQDLMQDYELKRQAQLMELDGLYRTETMLKQTISKLEQQYQDELNLLNNEFELKKSKFSLEYQALEDELSASLMNKKNALSDNLAALEAKYKVDAQAIIDNYKVEYENYDNQYKHQLELIQQNYRYTSSYTHLLGEFKKGLRFYKSMILLHALTLPLATYLFFSFYITVLGYYSRSSGGFGNFMAYAGSSLIGLIGFYWIVKFTWRNIRLNHFLHLKNDNANKDVSALFLTLNDKNLDLNHSLANHKDRFQVIKKYLYALNNKTVQLLESFKYETFVYKNRPSDVDLVKIVNYEDEGANGSKSLKEKLNEVQ